MDHHFQIFLHIVLFAVWFGSTIAVLVMLSRFWGGALATPMQAVQPRALKSLMYIVRIPKTAFILMLPMGLQLAGNLELITLASGTTYGAWAFALVWLAIDWKAAPSGQGDISKAMRVLERVLQATFVLVLGGAGTLSLLSGNPVESAWLATKMMIYAGTLIVMALFDLSLVQAHAAIGGEPGGTPDPDGAGAAQKGALNRAFVLLVLLLIMLLWAAWTGYNSWRV